MHGNHFLLIGVHGRHGERVAWLLLQILELRLYMCCWMPANRPCRSLIRGCLNALVDRKIFHGLLMPPYCLAIVDHGSSPGHYH